MKPEPETIAKERARLLQIIATDCPQRKPGARVRAWLDTRQRAIEELRRLDAGEIDESEDGPW